MILRLIICLGGSPAFMCQSSLHKVRGSCCPQMVGAHIVSHGAPHINLQGYIDPTMNQLWCSVDQLPQDVVRKSPSLVFKGSVRSSFWTLMGHNHNHIQLNCTLRSLELDRTTEDQFILVWLQLINQSQPV